MAEGQHKVLSLLFQLPLAPSPPLGDRKTIDFIIWPTPISTDLLVESHKWEINNIT